MRIRSQYCDKTNNESVLSRRDYWCCNGDCDCVAGKRTTTTTEWSHVNKLIVSEIGEKSAVSSDVESF